MFKQLCVNDIFVKWKQTVHISLQQLHVKVLCKLIKVKQHLTGCLFCADIL